MSRHSTTRTVATLTGAAAIVIGSACGSGADDSADVDAADAPEPTEQSVETEPPTDAPESTDTEADDTGTAEQSDDESHDDESHDDESHDSHDDDAHDDESHDSHDDEHAVDAVAPGGHSPAVLGGGIGLTIAESARIEMDTTGGLIVRPESFQDDDRALIGFVSVVGVVPPELAEEHQEHDPVVPESTVEMPESLARWFDAVPEVTVVDSGRHTVLDGTADWWRITVEPSADGTGFSCPLGSSCMSFLVNDEFGVLTLSDEIEVVVYQLDAVPGVLAWAQSGDASDTAAVQAAMEQMLDSLTPSGTSASAAAEPLVATNIDGVGATPEEADGAVFEAGAYEFGLLDPFGFEADEPFRVRISDPDFVLVRDPSWPLEERAGAINFFELNGLALPEMAADESVRNTEGPAQPDGFQPTPVDLAAWVDAVPTVSVSDEGTIEAPGTTVRWWDLEVDPSAGPTFRCAADTADCVGALVTSPTSTGVVPLQAQNLQRIYLIDGQPGVVGLVDAREAEFFDRGVEIMDMIVSSLRPTE